MTNLNSYGLFFFAMNMNIKNGGKYAKRNAKYQWKFN